MVATIWDCDSPLIPADMQNVSMKEALYWVRNNLIIERIVEVSDNVVTIFYQSSWIGANITFVTLREN